MSKRKSSEIEKDEEVVAKRKRHQTVYKYLSGDSTEFPVIQLQQGIKIIEVEELSNLVLRLESDECSIEVGGKISPQEVVGVLPFLILNCEMKDQRAKLYRQYLQLAEESREQEIQLASVKPETKWNKFHKFLLHMPKAEFDQLQTDFPRTFTSQIVAIISKVGLEKALDKEFRLIDTNNSRLLKYMSYADKMNILAIIKKKKKNHPAIVFSEELKQLLLDTNDANIVFKTYKVLEILPNERLLRIYTMLPKEKFINYLVSTCCVDFFSKFVQVEENLPVYKQIICSEYFREDKEKILIQFATSKSKERAISVLSSILAWPEDFNILKKFVNHHFSLENVATSFYDVAKLFPTVTQPPKRQSVSTLRGSSPSRTHENPLDFIWQKIPIEYPKTKVISQFCSFEYSEHVTKYLLEKMVKIIMQSFEPKLLQSIAISDKCQRFDIGRRFTNFGLAILSELYSLFCSDQGLRDYLPDFFAFVLQSPDGKKIWDPHSFRSLSIIPIEDKNMKLLLKKLHLLAQVKRQSITAVAYYKKITKKFAERQKNVQTTELPFCYISSQFSNFESYLSMFQELNDMDKLDRLLLSLRLFENHPNPEVMGEDLMMIEKLILQKNLLPLDPKIKTWFLDDFFSVFKLYKYFPILLKDLGENHPFVLSCFDKPLLARDKFQKVIKLAVLLKEDGVPLHQTLHYQSVDENVKEYVVPRLQRLLVEKRVFACIPDNFQYMPIPRFDYLGYQLFLEKIASLTELEVFKNVPTEKLLHPRFIFDDFRKDINFPCNKKTVENHLVPFLSNYIVCQESECNSEY